MGDPIKVAVCEALLAINADGPDPAHPFIPPTAIDWIGELVGCRVRSVLEGHAVIDGEVVALEPWSGYEVVVHHAPGFADDGHASMGQVGHEPIPPEVGINGHVGTWTTVHPVFYAVAGGAPDTEDPS